MFEYKSIIISADDSVSHTLKVIDQGGRRFAIVCDDNMKLLGTVTDGDIRRALLNDISMEQAIGGVMNSQPTITTKDKTIAENMKLLTGNDLQLLPVVDESGTLIDIFTSSNAPSIEPIDNRVFIMAGGFGTRLHPLTDDCPKPMLKIGNKPILEHLINHLSLQGFHKFTLSTHYMPEVIQNHFGDGGNYGVEITYTYEDKPLGTGGAISLLDKDEIDLPFILINGDLLTKLDFKKLLSYHTENQFDATIGVREIEHEIRYGVIEADHYLVKNIVEKPVYRYLVNAGVYVISPDCLASIETGQVIDMPDLLVNRIKQGKNLGHYTIHDYWLDIGTMPDFQKAQLDIEKLD